MTLDPKANFVVISLPHAETFLAGDGPAAYPNALVNWQGLVNPESRQAAPSGQHLYRR